MAIRSEFLAMLPTRQYDVMTALRGPDHLSRKVDRNTPQVYTYLSKVKAIVTARLRAIVFEDSMDCHGGAYTTRPLDMSEIETLGSVPYGFHGEHGIEHVIDHLRSALVATADLPIWGGPAVWQALYTRLTS